jgi:CRISPR type III-A-associated RAMP protein Csm4
MLPSGAITSFSVRFRPQGPWRFGPDTGARDRVDLIDHSDAVFSAVCSAMSQLGLAEDWLDATARSETGPVARFSSFYPFQGHTLLAVPPRNIWPPPEATKIRCKGARFVPLGVVESLLAGKGIDENRWAVDGESECLIPHDAGRGPFRIAVRSNASVDRLEPSKVESHATACLEFAQNAGLWTVVQFADSAAVEKWEGPVRSALRLLADSGFGGERSRGWGRSDTPQWQPWNPPTVAEAPDATPERAHWLLSLYLPSAGDSVDWKRGSYSTLTRRGRIESSARWGEIKPPTLMIEEGSVLLAGTDALRGAAHDTAPAGFPHPVYRAGFAVTVPIPWRAAA